MRKTGFTLLELVVVIFIVSLLAALAYPAFRTDSSKVKEEARKTASLLRYLSDSAIATKRTYSLRFDLDAHTIEWDGPEGKRQDTFSTLREVSLQSKGAIKDGTVTVFSGPVGFEEFIKVEFSEADTALSVEFNPISGRAKIKTK